MTLAVDSQTQQLREHALETAKRYKASWIELGQYLFSIYKDKHFRNWNYLSFETYCAKELGIKQTTASKLIKSYEFLEKEEPRITSPTYAEEAPPAKVPNYESVNLLRLARENKKITAQEFSDLRESVLEKAREPKEVRAEVKKILERKEDKDSLELKQSRRRASIKRVITMLNALKADLESEHAVPNYLLKQMADLAHKLADQIEN